MFKLFKKRAAPVATPEKPKAIDWANMWQSFINAQNAEIREPMTLAQMRLDGQAKDRGSVKGMRMYNEHKAKLQNQWVNPLQSVNSGFGNAQFAYYNYQTVNYFQCYQLAQDPLFTKVFNMLSNTPFSKGGQLTQPEGAELDEDAIEKAADRYRLWEEIRSAVRSSYVAGGCLIYLDFGQTEEERGQPLRLRKANMRKFVGFKHIDAINITAVNVNTIDPTRQDYMRPDMWYVIGLGVVHRSHFLHFEANPPELPMRPLTLYFGMPLTQLIKQDIANSNLVSQGVANLINRSRLVYLTADDTAFATDNAGQFRARLEWMSMVQDNFGVAPLKQGETVQQLTTALTGFAENVEQCYLLISAKTDIPFTELMGKSASGMNATGEGDRRKWYDKCRTIQESVKREILTMYGIVAGKIGDGKFVEFPDYVFNPLEEATEKELAENIKAYTEVANGLVGLGADPAGVVEWLKSFKQFNLEEIDFDTSAPGLEGYDDDTDPDGTPGGGLPREDITPKVLEAVRAMNATEDKNGCMHDDGNGQFVSKSDTGFNQPDGDGSSGAKIRVVVKPVSDITNARKEMFTWYRNNLQGKTVVHPKLGEIKFSRKGGTHSMHGASEEKIVLIPHIKEIISTGTTDGWEPLKHPRDDGFAEFAVVRNTVAINGKDTKVGCFIAKDVNGKIYYDLFINKAADSYIPEDVVRANNGLDIDSVNQENKVVNIFILNKE
ncbi:MAG: DUF1073 domain-containing protein [Alphaproteobacteria bacterium]|nr:DUF1073 domain-containing protein [Alphaproteobacteria bacterium]